MPDHQREKELTIHAPCCGAKLTVYYDGTGGEGWIRSSDLPSRCPKGHDLPIAVRIPLEDWLDERAVGGENDRDIRDLCGLDEARR